MSYLGDASRVLDNVRDHRTGNVRDHRTGRPLVLPPPPPRPGSSPGSGGGIRQLQADVEQAKQAFLANPQDIEAMIAYQDAQQKLQLAAKLVSEESSMYASIENSIIQKTRVS